MSLLEEVHRLRHEFMAKTGREPTRVHVPKKILKELESMMIFPRDPISSEHKMTLLGMDVTLTNDGGLAVARDE